MKTCFKSLSLPLVGLLLGGGSVTVYAGTASTVFNFTATFVGGSCDISAPASVQFNGGNAFSSNEIEQKVAATTESLTLTLSGCSGWGLTPAINVSGQTTTELGGESLFRDVMGPVDAKGYGILLQTEGNGVFAPNANLAQSGKITPINWDSDAKLNTLSGVSATVPLTATLTCGNCNYAGRQGGEFKATVTFDFVYE
jgi:type 1 fimbria pilin